MTGGRRSCALVLAAVAAVLSLLPSGASAGAQPGGAGASPPVTVEPPGPPRQVSGIIRHGAVRVSWSLPRRTGGARVTAYEVVASPSGASCTTDGKRACLVTGLENRQPHTFQVRAGNLAGWGPWSAPTRSYKPKRAVADAVSAVTRRRVEETLARLVGERRTPEQRAAARDVIRDELEGAGYEVTEQPFTSGTAEGVNLVARRKGRDADAPLTVIGAHYDTVEGSPGADDNASGVAGVIEAARALREVRPRTPVEFVLFDLEEVGLRGSRHYVATAAESSIGAAVILDMIGYTCDTPGCQVPIPNLPGCMRVHPEGRDVGVGIAAAGDEQSWTLLDSLARSSARHVPSLEVGTGHLSGDGTCLPPARRSDHVPFWDGDLPAVILSDTAELRNPNYHSASDTPDTIDPVFNARVTRAAVAAAARAAGVPG